MSEPTVSSLAWRIRAASTLRRPISEIIAEHRSSILACSRIAAFIALIIYCLIGAIMLPVSSLKLIPNQLENTYPESSVLFEAQLSARTGHLYFPLLERPYLSQPYGPLFYVTNMLIAKSAGLDSTATMIRARSFIFGAYLLCGLMIFALNRRLGFSWVYSSLAALLLLGIPKFLYWNVSVRPDIPYLLAMLVCVYFAIRNEDSSRFDLFASGLAGAIGVLFKQPAIAAPAAVVIVLILRRKYRDAALFCTTFMLVVGFIVGFLLLRHEPFLEQSASVAKGALWSARFGMKWIAQEFVLSTTLVPFLIGLVGIAAAIRGRKAERLLAVFAAITWLIFAATISQRGAGDNYLLPCFAVSAMLLPSAAVWLRKHLNFSWAMLLIAAALGWTSWRTLNLEQRLFFGHFKAHASQFDALHPFRIISDDPNFTLQGRDPELLDPFLFHSLELAGVWDATPVTKEIERQEIDLVILKCAWRSVLCSYRGIGYFGSDTLNAMSANYSVLCSTPHAWVLQPKDRDIPLRPSDFDLIMGMPCGTGQRGKQIHLQIAEGSR